MAAAVMMTFTACNSQKKTAGSDDEAQPVSQQFEADSAFQFCADQCAFGPRTMNSEAHEQCGQWIADKFAGYGLQVSRQTATLRGYDGTPLRATNIIASLNPEQQGNRILICAHWDSRPWADNDPNPDNHHTPVMAANDGASGVAVMLELARQLSQHPQNPQDPQHPQNPQNPQHPQSPPIDFICFDAEDWGIPQWAESTPDDGDTWALGAQHWAKNPHRRDFSYGILLDMVGGEGARFYQEGYSLHYAPTVVRNVWKAAQVAGYSSFFPSQGGGTITDDHVPVNQLANIPCIDLVPYHPDCEASSFGPTWHTVNDDMQHIDKMTLKAVGQTLLQLLLTE